MRGKVDLTSIVWLDRWTGQFVRHDNDRRRPRTTAEIYALNRAMAKRMEEVFVRRGIPVVPSIGAFAFCTEVLHFALNAFRRGLPQAIMMSGVGRIRPAWLAGADCALLPL